jgi:hypothetical protein
MSREEIRNQINTYEGDIANLEFEFSKKDRHAKKEIDEKFRSKFEIVLSKFKYIKQNVDKHDINVNEFIRINKNEKVALKILNKEIISLSKRKLMEIKEKLKLIKREKTFKVKSIKKQIRTLDKKLRSLKAKEFADRWRK